MDNSPTYFRNRYEAWLRIQKALRILNILEKYSNSGRGAFVKHAFKSWYVTLVFALAITSGCVPPATGTGATTSQPMPQATAGTSSSSADTSFVVRNESAEPVCYVQISPTSEGSWGPDRLSSNETIQPSQQRAWEVQPGMYDFRLMDCSRNAMLERRNVPIQGEGIALTYRARE